MKKKKKKTATDWELRLAELKAAEARQHRSACPPWVYGLVVGVVGLGAIWYAQNMPEEVPAGKNKLKNGLFVDNHPGENASRFSARPGERVTVPAECWGFSTVELARQATTAAGKSVKSYAMLVQDCAADDRAERFLPGTCCTVVDSDIGLGATYYRVRKETGSAGWWIHAELFAQ